MARPSSIATQLRLQSAFAASAVLLGTIASIATPAVASINTKVRQPPLLTREQVRSGLADRYRGMDARRNQYKDRRLDTRRRAEPSGSLSPVPRNPVAVPPPGALE